MGSVAIDDWSVSRVDLTRVVQYNNLGVEDTGFDGWVVFGITSDESSTDVFNGDVLYVKADVVSRYCFLELFVMHFHGLDFSGKTNRGEGNNGVGSQDTSFNSTDWDSTNTSDLVHVLEGDSKGLVNRSDRGGDGIEGFEEGRSFPPWHVGGFFQHVVSSPARDGDERDGFGIVTNFFDEVGDFVNDFLKSCLGVSNSFLVHFVGADNELFDTKGVSKEGVLSSLTVLGDTSFELTSRRGNDENSNIGLGGTSNHVFNEISVSGGIDNGEVEFGGFEFPKSNIDGDSSFTFGLKFVQDPGVFEGSFAHFVSLFFEFFDGTFINATAFVD